MPSLYETFGFPAVEAIVSGCLVVAARASCLPEIVGDEAGLVVPLNAESIADGNISVLTVPNRRSELVRLGTKPCEFVLLDDDRSEDSGFPGNCGNSEERKMLELDRDCTGKSVGTRGGALTADTRSTVIKGISIAARPKISG